MARFGRDLVRSLTQPGFIDQVSEVGMLAGSMPARKEKAEKTARLEKGLFGLEQMAASGELTPEMYQEAMGSYANMITDDESAQKIRETMNRVQTDVQATAQFEGGAAINAIRDRMYDVVNNSNLPDPEKTKRLGELQIEANTIAKENNLDPMVIGNLGRTVRQDMFEKNQQREQAKRVAKQFEITQEQAEMAVARFRQWEKDVDFQNLANEVTAQMNQDLLLKSQIRNGTVSREEFLQANPNKSYLYDEIEAENVEMQNRLTDAKNKRDAGGFNYTDEELKSIGYKPEEIKMLREAAKINPVAAHEYIIKRVNKIPQTRKLNAAMLGRISDALLVDIMDQKKPGKLYGETKIYSYENKDDLAEARAIAAKGAIRVEELMAEGMTFGEATEIYFVEEQKKADKKNKNQGSDATSSRC
jgi:uncharacterized protein YoaH (UPF0181 family)/uncharacterized protein with GYD domain